MSWNSDPVGYLQRIDDQICETHRKKFGISDNDMRQHDCDDLPCSVCCPFKV